ncbi:DUF6802 family protein [Actinophytocola sp. NPDC049390]|uniref:DUF6802 family protein n=1 Tax=Actinophytocola sp. NPDC049390 TaxID=3363894 RepID=UPI00378FDE4B
MDVPYDHIEDFADGATADDELTVEIDGEEYVVEENVDFDGDGANDTAVVATEDGGAIAFADTDGDGVADVAVEYDANGDIVVGAEYDETSGEWHEEDAEYLPTPTGDGADDSAGGSDSDTDTDSDTDSDDSGESTPVAEDTDYEAGEDDMTVDLPGEDVDAGPATYDTDGDGENDTAVVNDTDGTTYVFTDTDGDGQADEAAVVTSDGDVTIAAHTGEDEWTVVDEGHLNPDGSYESDQQAVAQG